MFIIYFIFRSFAMKAAAFSFWGVVDQAPDTRARFVGPEGETVEIAKIANTDGKPFALLYFFETFCPVCANEMVKISTFAERIGSSVAVKAICINRENLCAE